MVGVSLLLTQRDQAGGTSYEQAHLPFGKALNAESTITNNNKRFTSYDRSAPTGLDYAVNRTYDSKQGRFTQVDPIGMGATSLSAPQTLNLYTYCGNDPINNVDPSGLFWGFLKKLFKWILVAIAVIVAVLTIIAAPATLAGILGAISASAAAGSSVMNALGYATAAKVFGWIAIATGIGAGLAAMQAGSNQSLIIKNFASTAEKTAPMWQRILGGISAAGAIANSFAKTASKTKPQCPPKSAAITFFTNYQQWSVYEKAVNLTQETHREQGGWVYQDRSGRLKAVMKTVGSEDGNDFILLGNPPTVRGSRVVGTFHVHRGQSGGIDSYPSGSEEVGSDGYLHSIADYAVNRGQKVPGLLLARAPGGGVSTVIYGPNRGYMNVGIPAGCGQR